MGDAPAVITAGVFLYLPRTYLNSKFSASKVTIVFTFLSSSLNLLLYLWRMKEIRDEVKQLAKQILRRDN